MAQCAPPSRTKAHHVSPTALPTRGGGGVVGVVGVVVVVGGGGGGGGSQGVRECVAHGVQGCAAHVYMLA